MTPYYSYRPRYPRHVPYISVLSFKLYQNSLRILPRCVYHVSVAEILGYWGGSSPPPPPPPLLLCSHIAIVVVRYNVVLLPLRHYFIVQCPLLLPLVECEYSKVNGHHLVSMLYPLQEEGSLRDLLYWVGWYQSCS